jgi:RNA polymerase sigma factor, sigma-70 family
VRGAGDHGADVVGDSGGDPGDELQAQAAARREAELDRLAALAASGDEVSLRQLLEHLQLPVLRYCRARLGSRSVGLQTAEDVAQEVLLGVCGALKRFRPEETRMLAFVFGIASNKVVDAFRAAGRDRSEPTDRMPETPDTGSGPELEAVLVTQVDELRKLLELLPEQHREVLVMRVAMRFSAEETARAIGSTAGAVRVTQHRAMARLRKLVAGRAVAGDG